jgi:hypothetical protein
MRKLRYLRAFLLILGVMFPAYAKAQEENAVSLGDLARSLRQSKTPKEPAAADIIDNDNLSQVIDDVEHFRQDGKPIFSFDAAGTNFRMSSPDGTCSLSFNANATALLSSPYVSQDLPPSELAKLDGPANIHGDTLEVSVYNASAWNVKEITVGLTIVRPRDAVAASHEAAKLLPAVAQDVVQDVVQDKDTPPAEKRSDLTVLLHMKGTTAPLATTIYREKLDANLDDKQDWHWAIIDAKGIPPSTIATDLNTNSPVNDSSK